MKALCVLLVFVLFATVNGFVLPQLSQLVDIVTSFHLEPVVGPDGKSHHFYQNLGPVPVVERPSTLSIEDIKKYLSFFHIQPKSGADGALHFWYRDTENSELGPEDVMTVFRSDISNKVLEPGRMFHKIGAAYDISDVEYQLLGANEKQFFVPINSNEDIEKYLQDWGNQATKFTKTPQQSISSLEATVTKYRSNLSNQPLEFGKFYHLRGGHFDITDQEFQRLSPSEKTQFTRIDCESDLKNFASDWGSTAEAVVSKLPVNLNSGKSSITFENISHHAASPAILPTATLQPPKINSNVLGTPIKLPPAPKISINPQKKSTEESTTLGKLIRQ